MGPNAKITLEYLEALKESVQQFPDHTIRERIQELKEKTNIELSESQLSKYLKTLGITKKRRRKTKESKRKRRNTGSKDSTKK